MQAPDGGSQRVVSPLMTGACNHAPPKEYAVGVCPRAPVNYRAGTWGHVNDVQSQERMIVRGGGRACNSN